MKMLFRLFMTLGATVISITAPLDLLHPSVVITEEIESDDGTKTKLLKVPAGEQFAVVMLSYIALDVLGFLYAQAGQDR